MFQTIFSLVRLRRFETPPNRDKTFGIDAATKRVGKRLQVNWRRTDMKTGRNYFLKTIAILAMGTLAAVLQSCTTTTRSMPTAERLVALGIVEADANLEALNRGRAIAIVDCRECHRQYWPQEFRSNRWPRLTRKMGDRASLRRDEIRDLRSYMIEASKTVETAEAVARRSTSDVLH